MPKVSAIVPNYNHARFLEQRIDSILAQTFQDFEIIFLDDNSTDDSQKIFSKYLGNPKISHNIVNEVNSNCTFKQWNRGIALATGEYIWIAESDDYAAPRFLEELVSILDRNHNVGLAYCQSFLVNDRSEILEPNFLACTNCIDRQRWMSDYMNNGKNECENFLAGKNTIPNASAVLIRKSIYLTEVGKRNEDFRAAGDWFTWLNILLNSDIYYISESLNYFRFCTQSVSRSTSKIPLVVQESFSIFNWIQKRVDISDRSRKIFFDMVLSWCLSYFVTGNSFLWKRDFDYYQQLLKVSHHYTSLCNLHWQLLLLPLNRYRYKLKLGTRLNKFKKSFNII
jgi:glycosyltransferase involved in cell wall biosynthesis